MATPQASTRLIAATDVRTFFRESLSTAMSNQRLHAREDTVAYIVNMLSAFTRADRLYEWTPEGYSLKPLALMLGDAVEARDEKHRCDSLRRLGDVALFVSGMFAESLRRKVIDVDYYISMGGSAYESLSESLRSASTRPGDSEVFAELAAQFTEFVEVLGELGEQTVLSNDADLMRWYERWMRTGSARAARILRRHGVYLFEHADNRSRH